MSLESLIFLTATLNSTFYVAAPNNTRDAFICFGPKDIWPSSWVRLNQSDDEKLMYNLKVYEAIFQMKNHIS